MRTTSHTFSCHTSQPGMWAGVAAPGRETTTSITLPTTRWAQPPPPSPSLPLQVGPDELRRNALLQLLVHLGKRDAFNELRTQQQVRGGGRLAP